MEKIVNSESKLLKESIRNNDQLFRLLFENSRDGIIAVNSEGWVLFANETAARNLGYSKEEFLKLNIIDIEAVESKVDFENHFSDMLEAKRLGFETRHRRKDGSLMDVEMQLSTFAINGETVGYSICRDITGRKRMEKALKESEQKYSTLVERGSDGIVILQDGVLKFVNQQMSKMTGIPAKDAYGQPFINLVHPEYRGLVSERYKMRIAGEDVPDRYEVGLLSGDGEMVLFEANASLIEYEGKPAVMAVLRDITERKRFEEGLREERNTLINIMNTMTDGLCIVSRDYNIEYVNPPFESEYGLLNGRKCYEYFHKRKEVCPWCPNQEVFAGRTVRWEQYSSDGKKIYDSIAIPIKNMNGTISKLGMFRDITERKLAEDRLKEAYQGLEAAQKASLIIMEDIEKEHKKLDASLREKDVLLRELHHRVKNNLQIMSSLMRLQARTITDNRYSGIFKDALNRITAMSLIHERLYRTEDMARIDFKHYISDLVNDLFQSYSVTEGRILLKSDVIDVQMDIDKAIPCGLIINELVANSIKYAFPEGRTGEIAVVLRQVSDREVELVVSDNGIGLPEGLNVRDTKGLGMQLVTTLAEDQLKGNIEINRDKRTEFRIRYKI